MRYRRSTKRNPYLAPIGIEAGTVWMHTGRTRVEPVEFLGFTRYGSGSSWGDPSQVEVRSLESGRTLSTTVDRLRVPRSGEVPVKGNPSAVYGAFRANPDWTEAELFAFLRQHPDGITVKELVYGFGGTSQGHTTRLEKLVERGALKRERWAKGGDHYLLSEKGNPKAGSGAWHLRRLKAQGPQKDHGVELAGYMGVRHANERKDLSPEAWDPRRRGFNVDYGMPTSRMDREFEESFPSWTRAQKDAYIKAYRTVINARLKPMMDERWGVGWYDRAHR